MVVVVIAGVVAFAELHKTSARSTSATLSSSVSSSSYGQPVTFTATIHWGDLEPTESKHPTGTVEFFDDGKRLGSIDASGGDPWVGQRTFTLSFGGATTPPLTKEGPGRLELATMLAVGTHHITTAYVAGASGGVWRSTTAHALTQTVTRAETSTKIGASVNPSTSGQTVTFTVTVTTPLGAGIPTGTVQFFVDDVAVAVGDLNGDAVADVNLSTLAVGTHTVVARYMGSTNFAKSSSPRLTNVRVNGANASTTTTTTTPKATTSTTTRATTTIAPSTAPAPTTTGPPRSTTTTPRAALENQR